QLLDPEVSKDSVTLGYVGLDNVKDTTVVKSDPPMDRFENSRLRYDMRMKGNERQTIHLEFRLCSDSMEADEPLASPQPEITGERVPPWFQEATTIVADDQVVTEIMTRSIDDLEALITEFPNAWFPCAGLPRFAVPFGRDGIFTALETIAWNPAVARDVLIFLAERQGKEENPWNYEQPGKIMHEMHTGELARLREVPFGLFYGSVDSTPLFLVLGAEYIRWTQDLELFRKLKPHFDAAWRWTETYGDIDGSGYIQYQ